MAGLPGLAPPVPVLPGLLQALPVLAPGLVEMPEGEEDLPQVPPVEGREAPVVLRLRQGERPLL